MGRRLAALIVLALAVAGCGGDDGGDRLTKEDYGSQLGQVCTDLNREINALGEPENLAEVGDFADEIIPKFEDALDRARDLRPPEDLQDEADEFIALGEQSLDTLRGIRDAAEDGDQERAQQLFEEAGEQDRRSDALARQLGATACTAD